MPGADLLLAHRKRPFSYAIALGQRRRDPRYAWATHAGIIRNDHEVIEARAHGVVITPLSEYDRIPHVIVDVWAHPAVKRRIVEFAEHAIGRRYGYAEIVSLAVYLTSGTRLRFAMDSQLICSALAAEALSREFIVPFEPLWAMPADLAEFFKVGRPDARRFDPR